MDTERWEKMQNLFHETAERPVSEQLAFLREACGTDQGLIADVLAMLSEDTQGGSLLDQPLPKVADALLNPRIALLSDFGPYRIKKHLGEGGMGVVYLAEREDFGGLVAIKVMRDGLLSPARRRRFAEEQRTLAQLEHPLIARIFDANTLSDGTPWFSMEYVDGLPIADFCRARGSTLVERLNLFRLVCEAVEYAHSHAIIHRDLKPSNILVKRDGSVKLLDFGIAKQLVAVDEPAEQTLLRAMTLGYAAPEQIRGGPVGTQTDVYSLGVILYELLTGRLPFEISNRSQTEAERAILNGEPESPSAVASKSATGLNSNKAAWAELDVLCLTGMHKDQDRRYRSVEALKRDVGHYLRGEPLEARPDTLSYRASKFVHRHRSALSLTAAATVLSASLVLFFTVRLARARTAALAEARRTDRIESFMLNLFDGGDKEAGPADSLRAVTLLDRGVKNAETLKAEPAVQAELYQTLGNIYQRLGKFDQADPLLSTALERRKAIIGSDSRDVAESLVALGLLRVDQGRLAEAEQLVREGLALDRRHLPSNDPAIEKDTSALGRVLEERGDYDGAVKTLEETVRRQLAQTEASTELSQSISELATAHLYLGHLDLASSLYKQALDMDRILFGAAHPRVAEDLYSMGLVQHDLGRDREAEQNYRQALAIDQSWYGDDHPDTALIMAAVGQSMAYQERYDDAAPVLQQAIRLQEHIFGKVHPQVAMGLSALGVLELRRGHLADAEKDFARAAEINRAVYDDRHYLVGVALMNLGEVYLAEKNNARAEQSYREALARLTEKLPPGHNSTAIAEVRLGHALVLQRKFTEAETHLRAGYEVLLKQPVANASRLHTTRSDFVTTYEALRQPELASKFRAELAAEGEGGDKSSKK